jgi:hypothetical protein
MEHEDSLSCSQDPANSPYPEPDESSHIVTCCFFGIHFNIFLFPSGFLTEILCAFFMCMFYDPHISFSFIWSS